MNYTILQLAQAFRDKKLKPSEVCSEYLNKIEKTNSDLNAYLTISGELAMQQAKEADGRAEKGELLNVLDGVPAAIKDIINTRGVRTSCASKILDNFVPPYDATIISKLKAAGLVMLGKTNTDEFACGGSTEYSAFGVTRNPWNKDCVAGGSSGGSAAAVSADLAVYSLGTDTGGSIRQPAAFCGISGLKVTYGRVSRSGVTAMASSLDTIGPFGKNCADLAAVMNVIAGNDKLDSTTPPVAVPDYSQNLNAKIQGLKIGIPNEYFGEGLSPEVRQKVMEAVKVFENAGAQVKEVSLPYTKYAVAIYYIIMPAELSANLSRFDGIRFGIKPEGEIADIADQFYRVRDQGFGDEVKRRILSGNYVLSAGYFDAYYLKAQKVRTLIIEDFANAFKDVDVLMTPVAPTTAFKIGEKSKDPLAMYLEDAFTIPASMAGLPALSVPCGFDSQNLPVGMQLIAPQFEEGFLLGLGAFFEQNTDWHLKVAA